MSSAVAAVAAGEAGASTVPDTGAGDRAGESSGANADAPSSSGLGSQGRKVSTQDIQLVQNLIERCLQMYMSQREVTLRFLAGHKLSCSLYPKCLHLLTITTHSSLHGLLSRYERCLALFLLAFRMSGIL